MKRKFVRKSPKIFITVAVILSLFGLGGKLSNSSLLDLSVLDQFFDSKPKIEVSKNQTEQDKYLMSLVFDSDVYPENIVNINDGKTSLSNEDEKLLKDNGDSEFWVDYSSLDSLGRSGEVVALVTYNAVYEHSSSVVERPSFSSTVRLAGEYQDGTYDSLKGAWKGSVSNNAKVQLDGYRGYLYNKSHSLAWSLGGDMEVHNLTLGTRAQNVGTNSGKGGMAYSETIIRNAIYDNHDTTVLYRIEPLYEGTELLPRGSKVSAYSTNDNGQTVNLNVWVFNAQKGVTIDYNNGQWKQ
jgi:hypothetical protein